MRHGRFKTASVLAVSILLAMVLPASADVFLVQKVYESSKFRDREPKVSEMTLRTWISEGRLRTDHGDPPGFIHIVRLDRRPGEIISYLIDSMKGGGGTYWTYCRPYEAPANRKTADGPTSGRESEEAARASRKLSGEALTLTDTGEVKVINGFNCRKYLLTGTLTQTEFTSEIWVTRDIVNALEGYGLTWGVRLHSYDYELRILAEARPPLEEMQTIRGFPVLVTEVEHNAYVHYERKLELLEFKESEAAPGQFDLPGGLTKKFRGAAAHPKVCED